MKKKNELAEGGPSEREILCTNHRAPSKSLFPFLFPFLISSSRPGVDGFFSFPLPFSYTPKPI